jgi:hypothetical protein
VLIVTTRVATTKLSHSATQQQCWSAELRFANNAEATRLVGMMKVLTFNYAAVDSNKSDVDASDFFIQKISTIIGRVWFWGYN